ncbi:MAG: T9SS type A sorting domain-containing protein [Flavobacteriales bacterium]
MDLKKNPHGKLATAASYSGMAVAFLLQHEAAAQVSYTDLDPDVVLHNETLDIDLDGDGTTDLTIGEASYSDSFSAEVRLPVGNSVRVMATFSGTPSPKVLDVGEAIGLFNADFQADGGNGLILAQHFSTNLGNWLNNDGYLGCRFVAGDGLAHYGWVELAVSATADTVLVKSYGYEQMPNTEIFAGEGSPAGIDGPARSGTLELSPNPAQNEITFSLPGAGTEPVRVTLLDPLGQVVRSVLPTPGERIRIDLSDLPAGVYFVRAVAGKRTYSGKVNKL